jgi:hypothetical protein
MESRDAGATHRHVEVEFIPATRAEQTPSARTPCTSTTTTDPTAPARGQRPAWPASPGFDELVVYARTRDKLIAKTEKKLRRIAASRGITDPIIRIEDAR